MLMLISSVTTIIYILFPVKTGNLGEELVKPIIESYLLTVSMKQ